MTTLIFSSSEEKTPLTPGRGSCQARAGLTLSPKGRGYLRD